MARLDVVAQESGVNVAPPASNPALDLAQSLADIHPDLNGALQGAANQLQGDAALQAKKDALVANGAKLADAVREGTILPTQNPWYIQAYNRESSAISAQKDLNKLQTDSTSWAEQTDPEAFQKKWNEGVGELAKGYTDPDSIAGFTAAQSQVSQQTLAANQAKNVQRITEERTQNVSALAADSLVQATRQTGGHLTGALAAQAMTAAQARWFATGGDQAGWNKIVFNAVTAAGFTTNDSTMIDLLKDPALIGQPDTAAPHAGVPGATTTPSLSLPAKSAPALISRPAPVGQGSVGLGLPFHEGDAAQAIQTLAPGAIITSQERSKVHNDKVGGVSNSMHLTGQATDLILPPAAPGRPAMTPAEFKAKLINAGLPVTEFLDEGDHVHWGWRPKGKAPASAGNALALGTGSQPPANAPSAQGPSGPSLYDQLGIAEQAETIRYHIDQNGSDAIQNKVRNLKATQAAEGQAALTYLYNTHGTSLLTGDYDVPGLISELRGQGVSPQGIASALSDLHSGVTDTQGLMEAKPKLYGNSPQNAQALFALDLEGKKTGWTPGYENRVGAQVLAGNITGEDGQKMVMGAVEKSKADQKIAMESGATVHNYQGLRDHAESLAQTIAFTTNRNYGLQLDDETFKQTREAIANAGGAYLETHPGDYAGAYQKMKLETANQLVALRKNNPGRTVRPSLQTQAGDNPRRAAP